MKHFYIARSPIHGIGLFAKHNIAAGTVLFMVAKVYPKFIMTELGKSFNHATNCNSDMIQDGNEVWQFSVRDIKAGEEITGDYRTALPWFDSDVTKLKN